MQIKFERSTVSVPSSTQSSGNVKCKESVCDSQKGWELGTGCTGTSDTTLLVCSQTGDEE